MPARFVHGNNLVSFLELLEQYSILVLELFGGLAMDLAGRELVVKYGDPLLLSAICLTVI